MRAVLLALLLLLLPLTTAAQDYPALPFEVFGTIDNDMLTANCNAPSNGRMRCSFVQVTLTRAGNQTEFEAKLSQTIDQMLAELGTDKQRSDMCKAAEMFANAFRTGVVPKGGDQAKFDQNMKVMPQEQKEDIVASSDELAAFCKDPNRRTAESLIRREHDKQLRTCIIRSRTYDKDFTSTDFGKTWVATDGPTGDCGVLVISKLEKATREGVTMTLWVYHARTIVTNKDERQAGAPICTTFDERDYFYNWRVDEKFLGCDYVKFGY